MTNDFEITFSLIKINLEKIENEHPSFTLVNQIL